MLSREHDGCRAKDRVDAGGEHAHTIVVILDCEINIRALAAANPVALPLQNFCGPAGFYFFDVRNQLFGVLSNAQKPLLDLFLGDRSATTPEIEQWFLRITKYAEELV